MNVYAAAFLAMLSCGAAIVFKKATKGNENDSAKESAGFAELEVLEPLGSTEYSRNDYGTSGEGVL
jgi:tRNA splicing ligase